MLLSRIKFPSSCVIGYHLMENESEIETSLRRNFSYDRKSGTLGMLEVPKRQETAKCHYQLV